MNARPGVRPCAVAGSFYPAQASVLQDQIDSLLGENPSLALPSPRAVIVPHAGYQYSGITAAAAYRQLRALRGRVSRVLLLGPAHRVYLEAMALPSATHFSTPLGDIPLDRKGMERALTLPWVTSSDEAHRQEHSLEVQLPFLQHVLGDFSLLPVVVGHCPTEAVACLIDALWRSEDTLLVISSDLSHFEEYDNAREHDLASCQHILSREGNLRGQDACGAGPINGLLASQRGRKYQVELLDYRNSGDTGGDKNRVVGYASFSLF